MASIIKSNTYADFNGREILTANNDGALTTQKILYPAFRLTKTTNQTISNETRTKITYETTNFDTDNAVSSSTFTAPVAGKYYFYSHSQVHAGANSNLNYCENYLYKNGTSIGYGLFDFRNNPGHNFSATYHLVVDMAVNDTMEVYVRCEDTSGDPEVQGNTTENRSFFGAYRIGS